MDLPILSVGYVITRTRRGTETFLDAGCRIVNTEETRKHIDWCSARGEYRAVITGVRATLDRTNEPIIVYTDHKEVANAIRDQRQFREPYFRHAVLSFLERFRDWHVTCIDRDDNELAHEQARIGLKVGRDLRTGGVV
jgi:ribonuclease HI